jgi:hypothetical protein
VITGVVIAGVAIIFLIMLALSINDFRKEYRTSGNAIDEIVKEFQHRIIALGEHHDWVNEQLFLAGNVQALYNAGVRYIFAEGDLPLDEDYFVMFYPWMGTGWGYEGSGLRQAIINFNNTLPSDGVIKMVHPEKNCWTI